jgi:hypothetical protein
LYTLVPVRIASRPTKRRNGWSSATIGESYTPSSVNIAAIASGFRVIAPA